MQIRFSNIVKPVNGFSLVSGLLGGALSAVMVVGTGASSQVKISAPIQEEITVRKIILVDGESKPRMVMQCDEEKLPLITMKGTHTLDTIKLGFRPNDGKVRPAAYLAMSCGDKITEHTAARLEANEHSAMVSVAKDANFKATVDCDKFGPTFDLVGEDGEVSMGRSSYTLSDGKELSTGTGSIRLLKGKKFIWQAP